MQDRKNTVVLATNNKGKIRELSEPLANYGLKILGLDRVLNIIDLEENGITFEENALQKARFVADKTGYVSIADDSGLEVDILNGAPGVYSARFASDLEFLAAETKDQRNNRKLLQVMDAVPMSNRQARFVCCMAVCKPFGEQMVVRGIWSGFILENLQGENGFGYDPLFFDPALGCSAASLDKDEKIKHSHRGHALRTLLGKWEKFWY